MIPTRYLTLRFWIARQKNREHAIWCRTQARQQSATLLGGGPYLSLLFQSYLPLTDRIKHGTI